MAAHFGPFVVLLGQHRADQADQGVTAGKIPARSVRRRISRLSRSFIRPLRPGQADQLFRLLSVRAVVGGW